jgi:hypothetical protein
MSKKQRTVWVRILLGLALVLAVIIVFFFIGYLVGSHLTGILPVV